MPPSNWAAVATKEVSRRHERRSFGPAAVSQSEALRDVIAGVGVWQWLATVRRRMKQRRTGITPCFMPPHTLRRRGRVRQRAKTPCARAGRTTGNVAARRCSVTRTPSS
jgi:hypothetical protein